MKRLLYLYLLFLAIAINNTAVAQDSSFTYKRLIKVNTLAAAFQKISLQGEYSLGKRFSLALGIAYAPERNVAKVSEAIRPFFSNVQFSSIAVTPEFRWYPSKKAKGPNGFYVAPYVRLKHAQATTSFAFIDTSGNNFNIPIKFSINSANIGAMLGYQWVFKNHFTLDWWIAGGHIGAAASSVGIDISGITVFLNSPEVKAEIDKVLDGASLPFWVEPMIHRYLQQNDIKFGWTQPNAGFRTGLTIGFAF